MVGLCGSYGSRRLDVEPIAAALSRSETDERFEYGTGRLRGSVIAHDRAGRPATVPGEGASLVVWGAVYSRERQQGYERRPPEVTTAEFCARAYAEDGIEALAEMNGEFVCLVEHPDGDRVRIVTDRLGTRPVYYRAERGAITFSTSIQALAGHPGIETGYVPEYLAEYLGTKTVRGLHTPLSGIEQLPPASVVTLDPDAGEVRAERYWQPIHRPENRPLSAFVDQFTERFLDAIDDRIRADRRYGLLLSGGSDSRLVLATLDRVDAYGFADPSGEVETARLVADLAGVPFTRFEHEPGYDRRLLRRNAAVSNFVGWFNEGRAIGVEATLRREVDALVSGLYADVLFKGWTTPTRRLSVPGASLPVPAAQNIETRADVLEARDTSTPPYLPDGVVERAHERNLSTGTPVVDHGMAYSSYGALSAHGFWFPLTNETSFDRYSDGQVLPTVHPFLDRRLIDLALRMPRAYALRYNLVDRALARLAPELAAVPHDASGLALSRPRWLHRLATMGAELRSDAAGNAATLRETDWIERLFERREPTIRALPLVEYDAVRRTYDAHMAGADHTAALCGLLTLLEMPITRTVTASRHERTPTP
ncbi:asparagine synthase-related protein [Halalkalicoccus jeotgali]|uniref:Asparagine synthase n=1 Tax=Halalkalicoccus jeotgali (strain DSM 18796 / CECT 7217 / JCM 14584 / KCTC 4019 / B3) TaxID=795797 RepID=D8JA66_HALJB|nr:asparagine synthase-related protein [Halalkalicoccus jeotgali]ADJ14588.1 asparagine synthase [Halalkalicoccus jeotgali B3]ELY39960.1 asparagine synthase [Halalkalicoccus jeotgali B3]